MPTRPGHHGGTYWNKRGTQPAPRGISCRRKEESWAWLLCQAPQAPAGVHSVPTHLPGSSTWRLPLLSTTSRGGRGCPTLTSTPWKVGVLEDMGGTGLQVWGRQALDPTGKRGFCGTEVPKWGCHSPGGPRDRSS